MFMIFIISNVNVTGVNYYNLNNVTDIWGSDDGVIVGSVTSNSNYPIYNNTGNSSPDSSDFDGSADYIKLPKELQSTIGGDQDFSISFWIYFDDLSGSSEIFSNRGTLESGPGNIIFQYYLPNTELWLSTHDGSGSVSHLTGYTPVINTWYHVALIRYSSNNHILMYINGVMEYEDTYATTLALTNNDYILGYNYQNSGDSLNGKMDEFKLFDSSLTDEEVLNLYNIGTISEPVFTNNWTIYPDHINTKTTFNVTSDNNVGSVTCLFYVNDVYATGGNDAGGELGFIFSDTFWSQGNNVIKSSCNDTVTVINNSITVFVDTVNPMINQVIWNPESKPTQIVQVNNSDIDENFYLNVSVSDDNLYSLNVSIYWSDDSSDVEYVNYTSNISTSQYSIRPKINFCIFDEFGYFIFKTTVCDSHTAISIKDIPITKFYDRIVVDSASNSNFDIVSKDLGITEFNYVKLDDRYTFDTKYDKEISNINFRVTSRNKINIIEGSKYDGHMIIGKKWLDFQEYNAKTVTLIRINDFIVDVNIIMNAPVLDTKFNSFGLLNCITQLDNASISPEGNITLLYPLNNTVVNVSNSVYNLSVIYLPQFLVSIPDNCTLLVDNVFNVTDFNIENNINNSLNISFLPPLAQVQDNYTIHVECQDLHRHPPVNELHIYETINDTFSIFNTATTTTTTTTTTTGVTTTTLLSGSGTISCEYNPNPYLKIYLPFIERNLIKWFCDFGDFETKRCYTYVKRKGEIIQTNPGRDAIEELGFIDYFEMGRFGSVYFTSVDLVPNFEYNFSVECFGGNSTYNFTAPVMPIDKALEDIVIPKAIYLQNSILALILLIILIILGVFVYRVIKK